ncbi:centromere kinetochore protein [Perkinsela sp. CCAP 1560/4]|nr:centromere kinetochore protein [Perkinsela sp. CCAP 1560/4]|eukprot:KNH06099.1 centromere kinetochore protein [Perkinsela sp. CCAP 1560/4]
MAAISSLGSIDEAYPVLCQLQDRIQETSKHQQGLVTACEVLKNELRCITENTNKVRSTIPALNIKYGEAMDVHSAIHVEHSTSVKIHQELHSRIQKLNEEMRQLVEKVKQLYSHPRIMTSDHLEKGISLGNMVKRGKTGIVAMASPFDENLAFLEDAVTANFCGLPDFEPTILLNMILYLSREYQRELNLSHRKILASGLLESDRIKTEQAKADVHSRHLITQISNNVKLSIAPLDEIDVAFPCDDVDWNTGRQETEPAAHRVCPDPKSKPKSTMLFRLKNDNLARTT